MSKYFVKMDVYEADDKKCENPQEMRVSMYNLSKVLQPENVAQILDDMNNTFDNTFKKGQELGRELHRSHRTVQRNHVMWALGILCGMAEQWPDWVDPRNHTAIETSDRIRRLLEEGELPFGPMV